VAKLGRWVAKSGRWMAKLGRRVAKSGRWVAKLGKWVAMLVAHLLAVGSSLGTNPDISQNYKMGDIGKEVTNTL
jgi:hypothetical protein